MYLFAHYFEQISLLYQNFELNLHAKLRIFCEIAKDYQHFNIKY